eukprot:3931994-Rhodomonas_salina.1
MPRRACRRRAGNSTRRGTGEHGTCPCDALWCSSPPPEGMRSRQTVIATPVCSCATGTLWPCCRQGRHDPPDRGSTSRRAAPCPGHRHSPLTPWTPRARAGAVRRVPGPCLPRDSRNFRGTAAGCHRCPDTIRRQPGKAQAVPWRGAHSCGEQLLATPSRQIMCGGQGAQSALLVRMRPGEHTQSCTPLAPATRVVWPSGHGCDPQEEWSQCTEGAVHAQWTVLTPPALDGAPAQAVCVFTCPGGRGEELRAG